MATFVFILFVYCAAPAQCSNNLTMAQIGPFYGKDAQAACELARQTLSRTVPDQGLARFAPDACFNLRTGFESR